MITETLRLDWIQLRRDIILHRRSMLPAVLIFAGFETYFVIRVNQPTFWLIFTCVYASFLTVIPLNRSDKFGTLAWSCTLPVTRADLVRGAYVTAWAVMAGLFVLAFALAAFVPGSRLVVSDFLVPGRLLLVAGIATFILALLLPFTVRFGLMGMLVMLVVFQIIGAGTFIVARLTGGMDAVEGGIGGAVRAIAGGLAALRDTLSGPLYYPVVLLALVLVNWASYHLALALFRRREL